MDDEPSLFQLFNGIRPMARDLGESPSTVASWKRNGRIPAEKQPHVLMVGERLGLPITAEHVVFPFGRAAWAVQVGITVADLAVACDRHAISQLSDAELIHAAKLLLITPSVRPYLLVEPYRRLADAVRAIESSAK